MHSTNNVSLGLAGVTDIFENIMKIGEKGVAVGFNIFDKMTQLKQLEEARKRTEAMVALTAQQRVMEEQLRQEQRLQAQLQAEQAGPGVQIAGMGMGTLVLLAGGGILLYTMFGQKQS